MGELPAFRDRLEEKLAAEPPAAPEISRPWWHRPAVQWGGLAAALALGGALWFLTTAFRFDSVSVGQSACGRGLARASALTYRRIVYKTKPESRVVVLPAEKLVLISAQ